MNENKYKVLIDKAVYAENMTIETAVILVKALFVEYYADHKMEITIKEMERCESDEV